jgi:WD40 repeat protein
MFEHLVAQPDGNLWMSCQRGVYAFHRLLGRPPRLLYEHDAGITALAVTPSGAYIASGDHDGQVLIFGAAERRFVGCIRVWAGFVEALAWDLDGETLVSASSGYWEHVTEHWQRPEERMEVLLGWPEPWWVYRWAPDFHAVAWLDDQEVCVRETATGKTTIYQGHWTRYQQPIQLAWSPDSRWLASADHTRINVWDPSTGKTRWRGGGPGSVITGLAWVSPNCLATAETPEVTLSPTRGRLTQWRLAAFSDQLDKGLTMRLDLPT